MPKPTALEMVAWLLADGFALRLDSPAAGVRLRMTDGERTGEWAAPDELGPDARTVPALQAVIESAYLHANPDAEGRDD